MSFKSQVISSFSLHILQDPEWDVSSAFFANAASHIRPKGTSRKSRDDKENEAKKELVQEGQYAQAATMFTEAIKCDPKDYRYMFFGNRSYCYSCLEHYPQALADGERSIQLAPDWPKGYFRKGIALMGMKRYSEAEKEMEKVLRLDKDCEEAVTDLFNCKVLQLMVIQLWFVVDQVLYVCIICAKLTSCILSLGAWV
uniref:Uncharacterized protein n=1 Tax=Neogobius melanostomus TaxID=47308 RepID=A0A8C6UFU2_9GOBI